MKQRLLVLSCSDRKVCFPEAQPAFRVYDGPAFRVVRKYADDLKAFYEEQRIEYKGREGISLAAPYLTVVIVSAKYGPIPWGKPIEFYDQKLTPAQANANREEWCQKLKHHCQIWKPEEAFIYGGVNYKLAVPPTKWRPLGCPVVLGTGGLGHQLGQLKFWLEKGNDVI